MVHPGGSRRHRLHCQVAQQRLQTTDHSAAAVLCCCCCCDDRGKPTVCNVERVETAVFVTYRSVTRWVLSVLFPSLFLLPFILFINICFFIYMFLFVLYIVILLKISLIVLHFSFNFNILLWLPPTPVLCCLLYLYIVNLFIFFFFPPGFKFILNFIYLSYSLLNLEQISQSYNICLLNLDTYFFWPSIHEIILPWI